MDFLGSAAAGAAGALDGASDHRTGKVKRRASSARRAATKSAQALDRSRSPDKDDPPDVQKEVAERVTVAPLYVEPGAAGDTMGVEGRHRHNMQKLFGYMAQVEKVVNEHAESFDAADLSVRVLKRQGHVQAVEFKTLKSILVQADVENKRVLVANDEALKSQELVRGLTSSS